METSASFEARLAPLPYSTICGSPSTDLPILREISFRMAAIFYLVVRTFLA